MNKIINGILNILKFILLFISFALTFYIILYMYQRLEKSFFDTLEIFVPYIILFIIMAVNHIFEQKQITSNMFYNITCCLVFIMVIFVGYRAITDDFMVMRSKMGYDINFNYFADIVAPMKSMIYLLIGANVLLMFTKDKKVVVDKVEEVKENIENKSNKNNKSIKDNVEIKTVKKEKKIKEVKTEKE